MALRFGPPPGEGEMTSDPSRFKQVLYNLLSNAIKFTPAGGAVTVAWEWIASARLDDPVVPEKEAGAIRLIVRDTGVGIAPDVEIHPTELDLKQGRDVVLSKALAMTSVL